MNDMLIGILSNVVIFWLGYKYGQHLTAVKVTKMLIDKDPTLQKMVDRARVELSKLEVEEKVKQDQSEMIRVERIDDQLYIYQKDSNEFLGQGFTLQDALDNIQKRFPGRVFKGHLSKEEADELGISVK